MKWVTAVLVVLNVGVFLWGRFHHHPAPTGPHPRPAVNAGAMQLLGHQELPAPLRARAAGRCFSLGPFSRPAPAAAAAKDLAGRGLKTATRPAKEAVVDGYRVLVGPFRSREAAEGVRRRLTELGESDHYILRGGADNTVALGFFSSRRGAEAYVRRLNAKGVAAYLRARTLPPRAVYWVDIDDRAGGAGLAAGPAPAPWRITGAALVVRPCGNGAG